MSIEYIFSWAQNEHGELIHIDNVPNGKNCKCICPHCKEELIARHGDIRQHGFAHHSKKRGANLKICYMVTLYKLAEQIILSQKKIFAPSYYGIYKEKVIEFTDVKIDSRYERNDKQPDVIATTKNNQEFLIEFIFQEKVQHLIDLNYHNLSCIEIDLSNQPMENLSDFLLKSDKDRRWINNENYFNGIEEKYTKANKPISIKNESDCNLCKIRHRCCAVKVPKSDDHLIIRHNGQSFRLCKTNDFNKLSEYKNTQQLIPEDDKTKMVTTLNRQKQSIYTKDRKRLLEIYNQKRAQFSSQKPIKQQNNSCSNCKKQNYCFTRERYNFYNTNSNYFFANQCHEYEPI